MHIIIKRKLNLIHTVYQIQLIKITNNKFSKKHTYRLNAN